MLIRPHERNIDMPRTKKHSFFHFKWEFFFYCSITVVPILPLWLSPTLPTHHSHGQSPPHWPCPWVLSTCSLTRPFPFFPPLPPFPQSLSVFSLFPYLQFYFVHLFCSQGALHSMWWFSFEVTRNLSISEFQLSPVK